MKRILGLSCLILFLVSSTPAEANHRKGTYGTHGYVYFATYWDYAEVWVTSSSCNDRETGAFLRVWTSTFDTVELRDRWPSGINLVRKTCTSTVTATIDIDLEYSSFKSTHGGDTHGGENHSTAAKSDWCFGLARDYPCGYHPSTVHINLDKWNIRSNTWRERLIMHETGHSLGLAHHCSSDSIMNDGTSGCNGGRWTQVMNYVSTDRQGIFNTYPNWPYE